MQVSSWYLAVRDWLYEFRLSLCAVLALCSMLTPLLILHGVHTGIISGLKERLMQDPTVLVIIPESVPPGGFTPEFLDTIRALSATQFCIARTRDVAAELQLSSDTGRFLTVTLEATAEGDPVLEQAKLRIPDVAEQSTETFVEAVFSHSAAQKLKIRQDDVLEGSLARRLRQGNRENAVLKIRVAGILPPTSLGTDTIFMRFSVLQAIQDYRDGFATALLSASGEPAPAYRTHESFRLYAKTLEDVEMLHAWFAKQGLSVRTKVREIASIRKLDSSLQLVVLIIAATAGTGFMAFMFSTMQASVRRKEKMLGMLRLLGYTGFSLLLYPISHALLTAFLGCALSFLLYVMIAMGLEQLFSAQIGGMVLCHIDVWHFPLILGGVSLLSTFASWQAAQRAALIEPSVVIREI